MNGTVIPGPRAWQSEPWVSPPGFEILRILGHGPRGTVYLAREVALQRVVALKVSPDRGGESRTTAVLEHDHIVRVYSETVRDGVRLVCRQYVPGATLAEVAADLGDLDRAGLTGQDILAVVDARTQGPNPFRAELARSRSEFSRLSFDEALAVVGAGIAEALHHAHRRGTLHLNLKPTNLLIDPYGRPFVADFTLFRERFGFTGRTPAQLISPYSAPELIAALEGGGERALTQLDSRADLFSLSVVLTELRGEKPALSEAHQRSRSATTLPELGLGAVLTAIGEAAPERRFPHAEVLAARLCGLLELTRVREAMPAQGFLMRFTARHPTLALFSVRLLPHIMGTLLCSAYCFFRRGLSLTGPQKAELLRITKGYNSLSYPTGMLAVLILALPLAWEFSRRSRGMGSESAQGKGPRSPGSPSARLAELRARSLKLPLRLAAVHTATWLPSIAVLTVAAYRITGHFNPAGFFHFSSAVVLSWLIATGYSTLYMAFFAIEVFYPRFLEIDPELRGTARAELAVASRLVDWLPPVLASIPLLAALLLVQQDPTHFGASGFRGFQLILVTLILVGALGFLFSVGAIRRLKRVIWALSGL